MINKHSSDSENKEASMSRKTKIYFLVLAVGIGLIAGSLYYKNDKGPNPTADNSDSPAEVGVDDKKGEASQNYLEGTLNNSDNLSLGNFKLISSLGEVYLKTTRDFSKLIGLQVIVLINGTMEKFELIDIQSKVAGDSYILPQ
ncbi:MAG: hypothetical protein HYT62_00345 [Candidatus Yanofskybacteria bacterium]|nr:hypothetical protein [Candidatus Yanofskybacteria bacterium]